MALDTSDPINSVKQQVISTLRGFASEDVNWENPDFVEGFPALSPDDVLARPTISVWEWDSESENTGYDNIVETNDLLASDPLYQEIRGVTVQVFLYVDIWVNRATQNRKVPVGPRVASRIKGKIVSRLMLHSECLNGLDLLYVRGLPRPTDPIHTNADMHTFERVEVGVSMVVWD